MSAFQQFSSAPANGADRTGGLARTPVFTQTGYAVQTILAYFSSSNSAFTAFTSGVSKTSLNEQLRDHSPGNWPVISHDGAFRSGSPRGCRGPLTLGFGWSDGEPMRFAMAAPIDLRNDFDSVARVTAAPREEDQGRAQSRRGLALAEVYDWQQDSDASRIGGVGLQIIRDWGCASKEWPHGPMEGPVDGECAGGRTPFLARYSTASGVGADHAGARRRARIPGRRRFRASCSGKDVAVVAVGDVRHHRPEE